jgi:hypothetical protein
MVYTMQGVLEKRKEKKKKKKTINRDVIPSRNPICCPVLRQPAPVLHVLSASRFCADSLDPGIRDPGPDRD